MLIDTEKSFIQTKSIILCADDYGQNDSISQAIINLIEKKRLSAISCMTTFPWWLSHAKALRPFQDQADLGLHFNLTQGHSLSHNKPFDPLKRIILKAFLKQLDKIKLQRELELQIDRFVEGVGRPPDFIDSHHHIHILPKIREVFLETYLKRGKFGYIRSIWDPALFFNINKAYLKQLVLQSCGARILKQQLMRQNIPHNASFSGIYHFPSSKKYNQFFVKFLDKTCDNGLIMCHPGLSADQEIGKARLNEYYYFSSDKFLEHCTGIVLSRFKAKYSSHFELPPVKNI